VPDAMGLGAELAMMKHEQKESDRTGSCRKMGVEEGTKNIWTQEGDRSQQQRETKPTGVPDGKPRDPEKQKTEPGGDKKKKKKTRLQGLCDGANGTRRRSS